MNLIEVKLYPSPPKEDILSKYVHVATIKDMYCEVLCIVYGGFEKRTYALINIVSRLFFLLYTCITYFNFNEQWWNQDCH